MNAKDYILEDMSAPENENRENELFNLLGVETDDEASQKANEILFIVSALAKKEFPDDQQKAIHESLKQRLGFSDGEEQGKLLEFVEILSEHKKQNSMTHNSAMKIAKDISQVQVIDRAATDRFKNALYETQRNHEEALKKYETDFIKAIQEDKDLPEYPKNPEACIVTGSMYEGDPMVLAVEEYFVEQALKTIQLMR